MAAWSEWFLSIADRTVKNAGSHGGAREISSAGTRDLPMDRETITGYSITNARDLGGAVALTQGNPLITSNRLYEITGG